MKTVQGDLLKLASEGMFDVVVHGCNCQCTMGAGIAKVIKETYPEAYQADLKTTKGDRTKLGTYSSAIVKRNGFEFTILNAYTQEHYQGEQPLVDYEALASAFKKIAKDFDGKRIGYPKIGAGLGGGDWNRISSLIDEALEGQDHTLVEFG